MTNVKFAGRAREEVLLRKTKQEQTLFLSSDKCHKKNMTNDTIIIAHNGYNIYNNEQGTTNETKNGKNLYNRTTVKFSAVPGTCSSQRLVY